MLRIVTEPHGAPQSADDFIRSDGKLSGEQRLDSHGCDG